MANEPEFISRPSANDPSTVQVLKNILLGGICRGYNYITVDNAAVKTFSTMGAAGDETPPEDSIIALIEVIGDTTSSSFKDIILVTEDGTDPDNSTNPTKGMIYGDRSWFQVKGLTNFSNARFIGIEAGKTHQLRISFYG